MRIFVRSFFKALRVVLGPVMLLKEALTRPKGVVRSQAGQETVDEACKGLALYHLLPKVAPALGSALPTLALSFALAWATRPTLDRS